jgi:hypothetical protein
MTDVYFDNIFTDLAMHDKIKAAQQSVVGVRKKVSGATIRPSLVKCKYLTSILTTLSFKPKSEPPRTASPSRLLMHLSRARRSTTLEERSMICAPLRSPVCLEPRRQQAQHLLHPRALHLAMQDLNRQEGMGTCACHLRLPRSCTSSPPLNSTSPDTSIHSDSSTTTRSPPSIPAPLFSPPAGPPPGHPASAAVGRHGGASDNDTPSSMPSPEVTAVGAKPSSGPANWSSSEFLCYRLFNLTNAERLIHPSLVNPYAALLAGKVKKADTEH